MNVLISFAPLEPYTFGTDQTFVYPGTGRTGKESYLATSLTMPEQTTLLGTLRYLVLEHRGLVRSDYGYSEKELAEMAEAGGAESFSFLKRDQSFGRIRSVSPVFLYRGEDRGVLVRNPFHNTAGESGYAPLPLGEPVETSSGTVALPAPDRYRAKEGRAEGFIDLKTLKIYRDLFAADTVTGNRKTSGTDVRKDGFYRREVVRLKAGYSFAVLADVAGDSLPEQTVAYMGMKRSAFRVRAVPAADVFPGADDAAPCDLLREAVEDSLSGGETWYYALSDLRLADAWRPSAFCIVERKSLRNMETDWRGPTDVRRRKRSAVQFHLASAGSVFAGDAPQLQENGNLQTAGYNILCRLGGR